MNSIRRFWKFTGDTRVSLCLIYALFADILIGSMVMKDHPELFHSLNNQSLQEWILSCGERNMHLACWLFVALFLLLCLAVTTTICGINKLIAIIRSPGWHGQWRELPELAPFILHLGFLMLLIGQLASHTIGVNSHGNILIVGGAINIPGTETKILLKDLKITFFGKSTTFLGMENSPCDCSATLSFVDSTGSHERRISLNQPCWYRGWSLFIEDFYPKTKNSARTSFINLTIRNDPGIILITAGALVFGLGLAMYLFLVMQSHADKERN
jgi:hypothetical protein